MTWSCLALANLLPNPHLLTYLLTYVPTSLIPYLPTYFITYLLNHLLTSLITYLFTYLLTYLLTYLVSNLPTYSLTYSLEQAQPQTLNPASRGGREIAFILVLVYVATCRNPFIPSFHSIGYVVFHLILHYWGHIPKPLSLHSSFHFLFHYPI